MRPTTYAFDARNRLIEEVQADGTTLSYQYDAAGNRTQLSVTPAGGSAVVTNYSYDVLNRLQAVTDSNGGITSYGYDAVGNRTSISYPNGSSQLYEYDTLNRLTTLKTYDGNGALVQQYDYTRHPTGRSTPVF